MPVVVGVKFTTTAHTLLEVWPHNSAALLDHRERLPEHVNHRRIKCSLYRTSVGWTRVFRQVRAVGRSTVGTTTGRALARKAGRKSTAVVPEMF